MKQVKTIIKFLRIIIVQCVIILPTVQGSHPVAAPFFFFCQYHSQTNQPGLAQGEVVVSVHIKENPEYYTPGKIYEVMVSSSTDFDGFMMTGLYTLPANAAKSLAIGSGRSPLLPNQFALGHSMLCAIVHSHISHKPSKTISFLWMAPAAGTGCVDFLATATLGHEVMFKDVLALQICEEGAEKKEDAQPELKEIHSPGLVLREDFETGDNFDNALWPKVSRGKMGDQCGNLLHGNAATFCESSGSRSLVSTSLNTSSATTLQFALGVGNCSSSTGDPKIDVSYGINKCTKWQILDSIEPNISSETTVHIICLPPAARAIDICFRWHQQTPKDGSSFRGCWGVDNIVINSATDYPEYLEDDFDPIDPGNWLFFPGGKVKKKCHAEGNGLIFHGNHHKQRYVTTRDLNLAASVNNEDIIFSEQFEKSLTKDWLIKGGDIGQECGVVSSKKALVMSGEGNRLVCLPYLDTSNVGSLQFYLVYGGDKCIVDNKGIAHDVPISLYAETNKGEHVIIRDTLHVSGMPPHLLTVPVPLESQTSRTRICWQQVNSEGKNKNVWAIDSVTLLSWLPSSITHVVQFKLNLNCGENATENNVAVEFSSDHGHNWHSVHDLCLPPSCNGSHSALKAHFVSSEFQGWKLITLPLPYPALVDGSRIRFLQSGNFDTSNWAIDNVFIGACPNGCNGHGKCTSQTCLCDMGYVGHACQDTVVSTPAFLTEMFPSSSEQSTPNFRQISGGELSYQCGTLGSGKAMVLKKTGVRRLITRNVNTTQNRFMQLTIRLGSPSFSSACSAPNHPSEAVYVHYSCNGGITWDLLETLSISKYQEPRHLSLPLPDSARKNDCSFSIWQPYHSGDGKDVWAVDDVMLSDSMINVISLNFSNAKAVNESVRYNFGAIKEHCRSDGKALCFDGDVHSSPTRSLETKSLNIGPSYMLQFDIVVGCGQPYNKAKNNKVHLECSTNQGMNWHLVHKPCLPSIGGCNGVFTQGTVYDPSEYRQWKRVTISLPSSTWSSSTRFRFQQTNFEEGDTWAVDNLYIGPQCPDLCSGHGRCMDGICLCDKGFYGKKCLPKEKLQAIIKKNFESIDEIKKEFEISGGLVVSAEEGCGIITSGAAIYFYQDGVRQLITRDLDTESIDFIQFFIRIGGGDPITCNNASERNESVLFQYSNDAGISWSLLRELYSKNYRQPRMEHIFLPRTARTSSTRLRWWQPQHSGEGKDQWALDDLYMDTNENQAIQNPGKNDVLVHENNLWSTVTKTSKQAWCGSVNETLVFNGEEKIKFAISRPLDLVEGHIISFQISVGCTEKFTWNSAVSLEYSLDSGINWLLAVQHCYPDSGCTEDAHEASIYYSGSHGYWTRILIPITRDLAQNQVLLRWIQDDSEYYNWPPAPIFALRKIYIGPPCLHHCSGHGDCSPSRCVCDPGYEGSTCTPIQSNPLGFTDRFDQGDRLSNLWEKSRGSSLGTGCGTLSLGKSLYFGSDGYRLAQTRDLDTRQIRSLQFVIRLGDVKNLPTCHQPHRRNENVFVEYSNNHGLTWHLLREIHYNLFSKKPVFVALDLPWEARSKSTCIRWWQPLGKSARDPLRAEWALDNVLVLISNTNPDGFQDNFSPIQIESWFLTQNGEPRKACLATDNALIFSSENVATERYAETWDFHIQASTFLQFSINMGCSHLTGSYSIQLEYSIDRGRTWSPVNPECIPSEVGCHGYQLGSTLLSEKHINWTRITVYLPERTISPATRFRWRELPQKSVGHTWALDNVYLGNGCPWMCSGHGYCDIGKCICDPGFSEPYCVPKVSLPCEMRDTFNNPSVNKTLWKEVYGAEASSRCGVLISGTALTFWKEGLRMVVTQDLDLTAGQFIQFIFKYGCRGSITSNVTRANGILLQYSNNGGITWHLLKELHYATETPPSFFIIPINDPSVRTNATRLRLWQPRHEGFGSLEWAIDDFLVGGMLVNPNVLYDPVETALQTDAWLFWPGSEVKSYCTSDNNGAKSLVFDTTEGERSVYTRDMTVSVDTVIQFKIKVGCGVITLPEDPVKLQYSVDQGRSWNLVKASWVPYSLSPNCLHQVETPSIFYSNAHQKWQRIVIPLKNLQICGNVRFRWYQGVYSLRDSPPEWALDEIYIGPSCPLHCSGHGSCLNGVICSCDSGYEGDLCHNIAPNPSFLKESFEGIEMDSKLWSRWSGAEISHGCGNLISGASLHFRYQGERMLITHDLDLTQISAIQFYLKLGCSSRRSSPEEQPVLLQYSIDGGVTWDLLEEFGFGEETKDSFPAYIAVELSQTARTNATRLRWWQPSSDGLFQEEWAIDHIFIGGDINGLLALNDDFVTSREANWVLTPGAVMEPVCGGRHNFLHFRDSDDSRYAVTTDVVVSETTYIQFQLAMGCKESSVCYNVALEYSVDMGKTWSLARKHCLPSDVDCMEYFESSVYFSDVYPFVTRINLLLPLYTRTHSTRFRWIQHPGFKSSQTWAVGQVYIGDECFNMCSGHGKCSVGKCHCDDGWAGASCSEPKSPLPKELRDQFTHNPSSMWYQIIGGVISDLCGPVAAGSALHFYGPCTRQIITKDLDLRNATIVQFHFRFGCITSPTSIDQSVFLQFSSNGGITWITAKELRFDQYLISSYISLPIPTEMHENGVRIRWWQPEHNGRAHSDWAIDSVYIGGEMIASSVLHDLWEGNFLLSSQWLVYDNIVSGHYCGSVKSVAIGNSTTSENATLETIDLHIREDHVLQFMISLGCNASWNDPVVPVNLQFSVDYGQTWLYVVPQFLPADLGFSGVASHPTVYHAPMKWQRITIPLTGITVSKWTRFRWHQRSTQELSVSHKWAMKDIYIGPACPLNCNGHGACYKFRCVCDKGYSGKYCSNANANIISFKDTFTDPKVDTTYWLQVFGGKIGDPCESLIEGSAIVFSGWGLRLLETTDMDLRDAKFIQYTAQLGGRGDGIACVNAFTRNQSIILQYSTDGGITWNLLHELDYILYSTARRDYLLLPNLARTPATRIRWWQATNLGTIENYKQPIVPAWALDNIHIGGSQINPPELYEDFENGINDQNWWFYPRSQIKEKFCSSTGNAIIWTSDDDIGERSITTRELIVDENYMIQFKVTVGCSQQFQCTTNHSIILEYSKDPTSNLWEEVLKECLPSNSMNHPDCSPYQLHLSSQYSANGYEKWTLVTIMLPEYTYSSSTQFRWIQVANNNGNKPLSLPPWGLDDVYIGEACPSMCWGRGTCIKGTCHCDAGFSGSDCRPTSNIFNGLSLLTTFTDGFEEGIKSDIWCNISGGKLGVECGSLAPNGHGKHLYFSDCGLRQTVTCNLDGSIASKIMFVLRIGTQEGSAQCHINTQTQRLSDKSVLFQYTINNGITWELIAIHSSQDFLMPRRVVYEIPSEAKVYGVKFRWWQPYHDGPGHDQWALDNVEFMALTQPEERRFRRRHLKTSKK